MTKNNHEAGYNILLLMSRMYFWILIVIFSVVENKIPITLVAFYLSFLIAIFFIKKYKKLSKTVNSFHYVVDLLVCAWALIYFDELMFSVFLCIFFVFIRYNEGFKCAVYLSLGYVIAYCIIFYVLVSPAGRVFPVSGLVSVGFIVFSTYLGYALNKIYSDKDFIIEDYSARIKNKDRLLSVLAHEIRTPLTMVVSSSGILLDELSEKVGENHFSFIKTINNSALRLVAIVEDILAKIKAEKTLLKINLEPMDLRCMIKEVVRNMEPILLRKEQYIRCVYPKLISQLIADEKWIHQALVNLIHNASKYIDRGGSILIDVKENEHFFVISVVDDGIGINDINRINILTDAPVNDTYRSYEEGAGIGLSIVKYIVEQHKGKLYVGAILGKGTTLSFTLPK